MTLFNCVLPTSFTVRNMERALQFYCDVLGFRIIGRDASLPRGAGEWSHPIWGPLAEHNPNEDFRAEWDVYQERVCGIFGARINVFHWLLAPDNKTVLELLEYAPPNSGECPPRRRAFNEPGKAIVVLAVTGLVEVCKKLREAGVALVSDPQFSKKGDGLAGSVYLHDADDNALCLIEYIKEDAHS